MENPEKEKTLSVISPSLGSVPVPMDMDDPERRLYSPEQKAKAYELYLEQIRAQGLEPLLSVTRAWRLVKFVDAGMVTLTPCCKCSGKFVTHTFELTKDYVCGLCNMPSRAGSARRKTTTRKAVAPTRKAASA